MKMILGPNMGKIEYKRTRLKRHEQVREKKEERKPISPRKKRGADCRREIKWSSHSSL
jgi:hypothetical protein